MKVYTIMRGIYQLKAHSLLPRVGESRTRLNRFKMRGEIFNKKLRSTLFIQRVVDIWIELPEIVEAGAITTFKIHLDMYVNRKGLEGKMLNADKWD